MPKGSPDAVLDAIDRYGWNTGFLMNIGDRKGAIVDTVIDKYRPKVSTAAMHCLHQSLALAVMT